MKNGEKGIIEEKHPSSHDGLEGGSEVGEREGEEAPSVGGGPTDRQT